MHAGESYEVSPGRRQFSLAGDQVTYRCIGTHTRPEKGGARKSVSVQEFVP